MNSWKWDPTVSLGNVLTVIGFIAALIAGYYATQQQIAEHALMLQTDRVDIDQLKSDTADHGKAILTQGEQIKALIQTLADGKAERLRFQEKVMDALTEIKENVADVKARVPAR